MIFDLPLLFVIWTADPILLELGPAQIRWYGLLFAAGFFFGHYIMAYVYKTEGKPEKELDTLLVYMVFSIVLGARLGHCLFYQPEIYLKNPIEILKIWEGGLASHGAGIGAIIALYIFSRKHPNTRFLYICDRIVLTVALGAAFIRLGNLYNSEIYGIETNNSFGFVYAKAAQNALEDNFETILSQVQVLGTGVDTVVDGQRYVKTLFVLDFKPNLNALQAEEVAKNRVFPAVMSYEEGRINFKLFSPTPTYEIAESKGLVQAQVYLWGVPRHPTQIYESSSSLLLFLILFLIWFLLKEKTPEGLLFGLFMVWIFSLRMFYETLKLNQVDFEEGMMFNMGQILSVPLVIVGLVSLFFAYKDWKAKQLVQS